MTRFLFNPLTNRLDLADTGADDPTIPTSFTTDVNSPSVPALNIEQVKGGNTTANNTFGIRTDGSSGSNLLTVQLTNKIFGTVTTTTNVQTTLVTFPFNTNTGPGTYFFDFHTVAYNLNGLSAGYQTQFCVRYTGSVGVLVNPQDYVTIEEGAMIDVHVDFDSTTANLIVSVTGLSGPEIHWQTSGTYYFVS